MSTLVTQAFPKLAVKCEIAPDQIPSMLKFLDSRRYWLFLWLLDWMVGHRIKIASRYVCYNMPYEFNASLLSVSRLWSLTTSHRRAWTLIICPLSLGLIYMNKRSAKASTPSWPSSTAKSSMSSPSQHWSGECSQEHRNNSGVCDPWRKYMWRVLLDFFYDT